MKASDMFQKITMSAGAFLLLAACSGKGDFDSDIRKNGGADRGRESGRSYGVSVGASSGQNGTRVEYDGVTYKWSAAEQMGFYVAPAGGNEPIVSNARFTSVNTEPTVSTDFEGEITEPMLTRVKADQKYDYYSYYPYKASTGGVGGLKVAFDLPGEISLTPDVFPTEYGFMIAKATMGAGDKPFSWLDAETGEQQLGSRVGFQYKHVFSYLGVYLKANLMGQAVNKIEISCADDSPMWGTAAVVDLSTGEMSFTGGTSLTVNIPAGLNVSKVLNKGFLWVPVNPALANKEFKIDFHTTANVVISENISGGTLQAGMKHRAGVQLPFFVDFSKGVSRESDSKSPGGTTIRQFSSCGHVITSNNKVSIDENSLQLPIAYWLFGDVPAGCIKLPWLDYNAIYAGYTPKSKYVRVKVEAAGPKTASVAGYRKLYYAGVDANNYDVSSVYFQMEDELTGLVFHDFDDAKSADDNGANNGKFNVQIGDDVYVTFRGGSGTIGYNNWVRKIWVYPNFDYVP